MNSLAIFVVIAASTFFVANGFQFQSQKLNQSDETPSFGTNQFYEGIFRARLDHFRPLNQERVAFTYHVNAEHYNPITNGPIYIYLKDYRDYSTRWLQSGLMFDIARETGAALVTFDYRYFGVNRPTATASLEDLQYLSIEQILADVADFITVVREGYSPVILWGSGFGGALAVWARSRYPHLVDAAWSSSGYIDPELASFGPYDTFEFTFNIQDDGQCRDLIKSTYNIISYLIGNGAGEYLSERLNLCHPVDASSDADISSLYELTVRAVNSYIDQYHYTGVRAFCADLNAIPLDPLNSLARWLRYVYGDSECFDHSYNTLIEANSNSTWGSAGTVEGRRQWYYLQCTQIGSFLLADDFTWIPGRINIDFHLQKCRDVFGFDFQFSSLQSAFYGLRNQFDQTITNVVYTNGLLDPFRYFGRLTDESGAGSVINMEFVSKSGDLPSQTVNDPQSVYNAKTEIRRLVLEWSDRT